MDRQEQGQDRTKETSGTTQCGSEEASDVTLEYAACPSCEWCIVNAVCSVVQCSDATVIDRRQRKTPSTCSMMQVDKTLLKVHAAPAWRLELETWRERERGKKECG